MSVLRRGRVRSGGLSFETGFLEDDTNRRHWDIPKVLGFSPR